MKKLLSILLILTVFGAFWGVPALGAAFPDTAGHWAEADIQAMAAAGVVSGYPDGTFRPDAPVTRAEFAKIICELYDLPTKDYGSFIYEDVDPNEWYYPYVPAFLITTHLQFMIIDEDYQLPRQLGDDFFKFGAQRPLTRIEAAQAMNFITDDESYIDDYDRYLRQMVEKGRTAADAADFGDNDYIACIAGEAMDRQLMVGDGEGCFRPYDSLSRAEVCALLNRAVTLYGATASPNVEINFGIIDSYVGYGAEESVDWAEEVLRLVNIERAKEGVGPLELDEELCAVAQLHSDDMVTRSFFSHENPDGQDPFDRMDSYGISFMAAAENIAVGYDSPAAVVKGWMNSPGHRSNILNSRYSKMGIAWACSEDNGVYYWTQCFTD